MSTKRKLSSKLGHPTVKPSAKPTAKDILDESRAVVLGGVKDGESRVNGIKEIVEISSDSSSDDEDGVEDEDEDDEVGAEVIDDNVQLTNEATKQEEDINMKDAEAQEPVPEEQAEPSFGDLILAHTSEPIDVAGAFADQALKTLPYPQHKQIQPPSGASLGTVLTQALKTNDVALLESCLHTQDISTIRATIQRLASPLAGILLQKLAERLHRRPGRAGSLMVWVQWTLVTHGGYLATQSDLIKKLAELNRVIDERARGLQSLLSLKGKLDMLEAQMQLRRAMRDQRQTLDDEDDEDAVIYVEGQEDDDESDAAVPPTASKPNGTAPSRRKRPSVSSSAVSEDMPTTANGIIADSAASSEDEESDVSNLIDDEAEETDAESGDEDQVDHSDQDELEDDDESDDAAPVRAAPPTKMQRVGGLFSSRRQAV
jgi:U3 small nucleolar RNA-associated protein 5